MPFHVMEVIELIFLVVQVLERLIERFFSKKRKTRHIISPIFRLIYFLAAIMNCVDLIVTDFLIDLKCVPYNLDSVAALQIAE